jgi:hypothetical protein
MLRKEEGGNGKISFRNSITTCYVQKKKKKQRKNTGDEPRRETKRHGREEAVQDKIRNMIRMWTKLTHRAMPC